ncbi:hypothetical protein [Rhizobium sophoriradicis]|uniref:hypothetical protein n=1 Tax=Rhizobium sophoriradicis TaxID=1535245 RepID=UPI00117AB0BD|nr:hypothetical protein [Rhizobium sophoriradicis]
MAGQDLQDVGWNDPYFAPYVARARNLSISRSDRAAILGSNVLFSIPVFGLSGVEKLSPLSNEWRVAIPLRPRLTSWPDCASTKPIVTTVPETDAQAAGLTPGSWYVRTFDFGCLQIVVEGDRNAPDKAALGSDQRSTPPESGTIEIRYEKENGNIEFDEAGRSIVPGAVSASQDRGAPVISYARGNLIYSFTIVCSQAESRPFCNDEASLRNLVAEFDVVAGQPQ